MITIFYIIETILIYFYSLGFSLNARPHKRQRFNHHRVEIKVVVVVVVVCVHDGIYNYRPDSDMDYFTRSNL